MRSMLEPRPDPVCDLSQACARVRADGMAMIDFGRMGGNSERAKRTKGPIFTVIKGSLLLSISAWMGRQSVPSGHAEAGANRA